MEFKLIRHFTNPYNIGYFFLLMVYAILAITKQHSTFMMSSDVPLNNDVFSSHLANLRGKCSHATISNLLYFYSTELSFIKVPDYDD